MKLSGAIYTIEWDATGAQLAVAIGDFGVSTIISYYSHSSVITDERITFHLLKINLYFSFHSQAEYFEITKLKKDQ